MAAFPKQKQTNDYSEWQRPLNLREKYVIYKILKVQVLVNASAKEL